MRFNNETFENAQDIVQAFSDYFSSVYSTSTNSDVTDFYDYNNVPIIHIESVTVDEVSTAIKNLKNGNISGPDLIPAFFIKDCAAVFAEPLTRIFNLALATNVFPDSWKNANVTPVFKSGDSNDVSNYRPISILSNFAKIFENVLYVRIYSKVRRLISIHQHGFMAHRSTTTNLACLSHVIAETIDKRGQVDVIYTDFKKAFDSIPHDIIIAKLFNFGFNEGLLKLFKSYLSNRSQRVLYNNFKSDSVIVTSGVPQGSTLGPLLFLLYINDLTALLKCGALLFADDLKLFTQVSSISDCQFLQEQLNSVVRWCSTNCLFLNISKCKIVTYAKKHQPIVYNYVVHSLRLTRVDLVKDLGVYFDSKFTFSHHIATVTRSAMSTLGFILRNCKSFNNMVALKALFFLLVRSKLEYCSLIWFTSSKKNIDLIEHVQRRFLKFLYYKTEGHYPPRGFCHETKLNLFHVSSLEDRRIKSSITFLFNIVHDKLDTPDLLSKINFLVPSYHYRLSLPFHLSPPRTNVLYMSPILSSCKTYNNLCKTVDIFNSTLTCIFTEINL
uniref:Reverse transcriptase domain-containing protein n=1 Tax=Photinus pyralis TaxID=7054 RepID=A0A1Y1KXC2_PHOPY